VAKTYNSIPSVATGDVYTAAAHNAIVENVNNYRVPPIFTVKRTTTQSITSGAQTFITWDSAATTNTDEVGVYSGPSETITIRTAGVYVVTLNVLFAAAATGVRLVRILVNPSSATDTTAVIANNLGPGTSGILPSVSTSVVWSFAANDVIKANVFQDSGGPINISETGGSRTNLSLAWLGQVS